MIITNSPTPFDNNITINEDVIKARKELGITQNTLGDITGIGQANISRIETGNFNPSVATLKKIADALGKKLIIRLE